MRRARGYTVMEVVIAMAVLAIGTAGIVSMQKVTAVANREARNLVLANQIARGWMDRLTTDAVGWNHPSPLSTASDLATDTVWLNGVATNGWFRPAANANGTAAADVFGNDLADTALADAVFCTNLRLTWLYGSGTATQGPFVIRAEVRVFWLREGGGGNVEANKPFCSPTLNTADVTAATTNFHFVYLTSAIAQNTGP